MAYRHPDRRPGAYSPTLTLNGKVESPEFTQAAAPGFGRVARVPVREGQVVAKGTPLVVLDARDFQPKVEQARGAVDELEASIRSENLRHAADLDQLDQERKLLDFASADLARFERLQKENFYSQAAVDQSRANLSKQQITLRSRELTISDHAARLAQLQARLVQARANLDQARLAMERSRVTAPFAGYVAKVMVAEGDQVNTGQVLISLYPADALEVRAKIPANYQEELLALLAGGQHPGAVAKLGQATVKLRLERAAAAADTRGLDGFFRVVEGDPALRLGSLLTVELTRPPMADVVAIPYGAIYNNRVVYRVEAGRLAAVPVEVLGEQAGERPMLLVRGPLARGDRVMTTHLPNAVTGLKVEVAGQ
ncbi:biotin/lipoyl-binding protein [Parasulfuritortus cantonensis]|uniref:Biotin/lipoyl-binding protein n=1 Tax=Parasulfuritortus cantonensis TaxID=2528202 RepID=A0A4R1BQ29_9PROT|nr:biotin/lipoyl-binding protein [Parasulfuritortus cantonensis]TCJ19780.1 biotin/lipoyl-binding protein [Parasulfuritortus cantonensis]